MIFSAYNQQLQHQQQLFNNIRNQAYGGGYAGAGAGGYAGAGAGSYSGGYAGSSGGNNYAPNYASAGGSLGSQGGNFTWIVLGENAYF